jgi:uncharacterized alkaline shock family protein YloU
VSNAATTELDLSPGPLTTGRGITTIAPSVAESVARRAATEVDGVSGVASSGLRRAFGVGPGSRVSASADVAGARTSLALSIGVRYPAPVAAVAARVRQHVRARVQELTGLAVDSIDITVAELPAPARTRRRVL